MARSKSAASSDLQVTALQTLALIGGGGSPVVTELAIGLLENEDDTIRQAAIAAAGDLRIIKATKQLYGGFWDLQRSITERQSTLQSLARLKAEDWPYSDRADPGVELVLPDLIRRVDSIKEPALLADVVWLVGEIDFAKAESMALALLEHEAVPVKNAAIELLGRKQEHAVILGRKLVDGKLPAGCKAQVVAALQRHQNADRAGAVDDLLNEIFRDGLTVSLEPKQLAIMKQRIEQQGDATRGRAVFLDAQKSQCITCHRIEGVGGVIGPDLNRVWQTHTVEKLIESIVDPSREIKEGFETWTVTTDGGQVFGGLKISDGPPRVVIRTATGRDHRIPVEEIDHLEASKRSLMPSRSFRN